jgi:hypothetical protein
MKRSLRNPFAGAGLRAVCQASADRGPKSQGRDLSLELAPKLRRQGRCRYEDLARPLPREDSGKGPKWNSRQQFSSTARRPRASACRRRSSRPSAAATGRASGWRSRATAIRRRWRGCAASSCSGQRRRPRAGRRRRRRRGGRPDRARQQSARAYSPRRSRRGAQPRSARKAGVRTALLQQQEAVRGSDRGRQDHRDAPTPSRQNHRRASSAAVRSRRCR